MKTIRRMVAAATFVAVLIALALACSSESPDDDLVLADAGPDSTTARPKVGAVNPTPAGYVIPYVSNGQPSLTGIPFGDAGYLLTAQGPTTAPFFAPAPVSLPTPFIAGDFLTNDGGVSYWSLIPAGFTAGGDLFVLADGGQGVQMAEGLAGSSFADAGGRTFNINANEAQFGADSGAPVYSWVGTATFTDATTWVNIFADGFKPAPRTTGKYALDFLVHDQADATDAGPVDHAACTIVFTVTVANGGNVWVTGGLGGDGPDSGANVSNFSCSGSLGGVSIASTTFAFRAMSTNGYVQVQGKGIAGKTYTGGFTLQLERVLK